MWIARNKPNKFYPNPKIYLFNERPQTIKFDNYISWIRNSKDYDKFYILDPDLFKFLTFEMGPIDIGKIEIPKMCRDFKDFQIYHTFKFYKDKIVLDFSDRSYNII